MSRSPKAPGRQDRERRDQSDPRQAASLGPKPGQRMKTLTDREMQTVLQHPAQIETYRHVVQLLGELRVSSSPRDFFRLQESLFECAFNVDRRRAECARARKRVARGKEPQDAGTDDPAWGDPMDPTSWQTEEFVHERLLRQYRSVGDSIAWTLFGHDRRVIASLASNASPGPLVKRADGQGQDARAAELDAVRSAVADGDFAVLHDLTNCLRIGDLSRINSEGAQVGEVKLNPRNVKVSQLRRMEAAISSIERQRPLPGSKMTIVDLTTRYRSNTRAIGDLFEKSRISGVAGAVLRQGQSLMVVDFRSMSARYGEDIDQGIKVIEAKRQSLWRRAAIDRPSSHRLHGRSADEAARVPLLPPYGIYPAAPDVCATLICDYAVFETHLSVEALASIHRLAPGASV